MFDRRFKKRGQRGRQLFRMGEGRDDAFEVKIAAKAAGDVIDMPRGIVQRHDFGQRPGIQRHAVGGGIADGEADDEIFTTGAANALDQQARKPGAVFHAAAPVIRAAVRPGRPELVQQRMIGGPNLDPLEPGLLAADRRIDMRLQQFLDFGPGHGMRAVAVMIGRPA